MLRFSNNDLIATIQVNVPILNFLSANLGDLMVIFLLQRIAQSTNLQDLNLCGNQITDGTINKIIESLVSNPNIHLESLDLGRNKISDAGAQQLLAALANNYSIVELNLRGNFNDDKIKPETLEQINAYLLRNQSNTQRLKPQTTSRK